MQSTKNNINEMDNIFEKVLGIMQNNSTAPQTKAFEVAMMLNEQFQ